MTLGERLRYAIECEDMKLIDFCEQAEMNYRTLQQYLHGHRSPQIDALEKIKTHLNISIDWLITGEGSMYGEGSDPKNREQLKALREEMLLDIYRTLSPEQQQKLYADAEREKQIVKQQEMMTAMQERITALEKRES